MREWLRRQEKANRDLYESRRAEFLRKHNLSGTEKLSMQADDSYWLGYFAGITEAFRSAEQYQAELEEDARNAT